MDVEAPFNEPLVVCYLSLQVQVPLGPTVWSCAAFFRHFELLSILDGLGEGMAVTAHFKKKTTTSSATANQDFGGTEDNGATQHATRPSSDYHRCTHQPRQSTTLTTSSTKTSSIPAPTAHSILPPAFVMRPMHHLTR